MKQNLPKINFLNIVKVFPAHELPIHIFKYGEEALAIKEKTGNYLTVEGIDEEIERLIKVYGNETLKSVFGTNFLENIEFSINKIISKEKEVDGSKNKSKSKDRISAETRV